MPDIRWRNGARALSADRTLSRRRVLQLAAGLLTVAALPARGADEATPLPEQWVSTWRGPWRLGMNSGKVVLVLTSDPAHPGTIAITNLSKFGDQPAELYKVAADGDKLAFRSAGVDNSVMKVNVVLNHEDDTLDGFIVHDGFTNLCKLKRVR